MLPANTATRFFLSVIHGQNKMANQYQIYLHNFRYFADNGRGFDDLESAILRAKEIGFDCTFYLNDEPVAFWSIIGGFRKVM